MSSPELEPPFVDPFYVSEVARAFPSVVRVDCPYCGARVGASCIDLAGNGQRRNHPSRVALLFSTNDRDRFRATRDAEEYPARPPDGARW